MIRHIVLFRWNEDAPHPAHQAAIASYIKPYVQPTMEVLDFEYGQD